MSASNPAVPEPTQIGKFRIVQKLGAGAFGTVYKAQDPELDRFVAIKTIRLEGLAASQASLDDLLARFKREAQVAAKLKHPNIVTIHEVGSLPGNSYLVMEFVDGVGLDRVIAKSGRMAVERAAAIGAQVANALAYAQKHNVVHRDIKPANIMIEAGDHVKVTDFGIAKVTDSVDHLTATGSLLGTPSYMSPEQARGGAIDGRSDLFSVGCVLYEMVAGQKAFRGDSITALLFKIIAEEPPPLKELDPTVSDEMIRIITKALSKSPETRYQSGTQLAEDLLAVTRPGFVPTLRATETPTLPPDAPPADVPTIASAPTLQSEVTRPGGAPATRPPAVPPLPPTIVTTPPAKATTPPLPPRPQAPAVARPAVPPVRPARRAGISPLILLGVAGFGLVLVAVAGWLLLSRLRARTEAPQETVSAPEAPTSPAPPAEAASSPGPSAEAAPAVTTTPAPPATTEAAGAGRVTSPGTPPPARSAAATVRPTPPPQTAAAGPSPEGAQGDVAGDYGFLDEPPSDTPDGRAAAEALARLYRGSGSSSGYTTSRFPRRPKVPRDLVPAEKPAAATLLYVHLAQEAYHRKSGRYGNLRELAAAGTFVLDVPFNADGFRRAGRSRSQGGPGAAFAFRLTVEGDGYRMDATPLGPFGRALMVDDSGFVRLRDE